MNKASELESQAALFLMRREESSWSSEDQAELDAWLDMSMAHKAAFWRLEYGWESANRLGSMGQTVVKPYRTITRFFTPQIAAVAAAILVLIAGAWVWDTLAARPTFQAEYQTAVGEHKIVMLYDGTRVEMNTDTDLRIELAGNHRLAWLNRGEIYLEVAHDSKRPFIINAGVRTVTVLGTKFAVWRDGDTLVVPVVEGRVRLDDKAEAASANPIIVTGDHVATAKGSSILVVAKPSMRIQDALLWRAGMLNFTDMTLGDAVAEFNRYNHKKLVISDPSAAAIRIGGVFRATNVDAFTSLLQRAFGFAVETTDDTVKISKR